MTTPTAVPEARTVLAQSVLSTLSGSSFSSSSSVLWTGEGGRGEDDTDYLLFIKHVIAHTDEVTRRRGEH